MTGVHIIPISLTNQNNILYNRREKNHRKTFFRWFRRIQSKCLSFQNQQFNGYDKFFDIIPELLRMKKIWISMQNVASNLRHLRELWPYFSHHFIIKFYIQTLTIHKYLYCNKMICIKWCTYVAFAYCIMILGRTIRHTFSIFAFSSGILCFIKFYFHAK